MRARSMRKPAPSSGPVPTARSGCPWSGPAGPRRTASARRRTARSCRSPSFRITCTSASTMSRTAPNSGLHRISSRWFCKNAPQMKALLFRNEALSHSRHRTISTELFLNVNDSLRRGASATRGETARRTIFRLAPATGEFTSWFRAG